MIFKNVCIIVLWMKVALALKGLTPCDCYLFEEVVAVVVEVVVEVVVWVR